MKRRLALLVCIIATLAMVFALASCGGDECEHTYSTEYTTDANGHWYVATCGCEGEVSNYGAHVDSNNDGKCDTCKYVLCAHTYETEWSTDENNHWNASNCDCTPTKANEAKHVDENKDGICDVCKYVMCEHTYSDWKTDETKHWKEATCGCTVANTEEGAHVDENKDGNCDTCAYVMCEHTYATEWSTDGAYHWYEATCGCNVVGSKAEHTNEDGDKLCDVCEANICEHTYADVLSYNETHHWYAATCGCDVKKDETEHAWAEAWTINDHKHYYVATCGCEVFKDAADHADEDEDGKCDACGHDTVVSDKIADLDGEAWSGTNSTTINKTVKYDGEEPTTEESYLKVYDNYTVQLDYNGNLRYYSYYGDNGENAFVVLIEGDEARRDEYTTVIEDVYYYSLVYWNVSANNHENMIKGLYNLGLNGAVDWEGNKTGTGYGLISAYDEATSTYSFSYLYVEDTAVYYVEASFTVDAEANGITSANVKIDQYSYASVAVNDDVLSYEIVEGAVAISETTYVIAQAFGDPMDSTEAPNPYPVEDYIVTEDFELVTKDENGEVVNTYNDGDTIELNAMDELVLYFGADILDVIKFNTITLTAIHTETETELSSWTSVGTIKVDTYDDNRPIKFVGKQGGAYTLTVDVEGVEVNLNINVKYLAPQSMSTFAINVDSGKGTSESEVTMYNAQSLLINSVVSAGRDPSFVAALTKGDAATLTKNENGTYTFKPSATGEFEVTLTSSVAETVTAKITITVVTPPTADEILVGTYKGDFMKYLMQGQKTGTITVVFTPAEEGATNGTLTVNVEGVEQTGSFWDPVETPFETNTTFTYTFTYEDSKITLTRTEGDDVTIELLVTTNYEIAAIYDNSELITLKAVAPVVPEEPSNATTSPFNMTVSDTYGYYDADAFTFVAGEAGTYTFTVPAGVGILVDWSNEVLNYFDNADGATFELELEANEEVILVPQATTTGDVTISYVVEEAAEVTGAGTSTNPYILPEATTLDIDYAGIDTVDYIYYTFTPSAAGTLTITVNGGFEDYDIGYGVDGFALTNSMFSPTATQVVAAGKTVYLKFSTWSGDAAEYSVTLSYVAEDAEEENASLEGTYNAVDNYENSIEVVITSDTITFTPVGSEDAISYTYEYENGIATYYDSLGIAITMPMQFSLTINEGAVTGMTYNGTGYTLTKA
ncbi:MAG: hypothetical protein J6C61_08680 [Clostridia bacterium]|nr:hypothetical protein [Clostridia bacterium]